MTGVAVPPSAARHRPSPRTTTNSRWGRRLSSAGRPRPSPASCTSAPARPSSTARPYSTSTGRRNAPAASRATPRTTPSTTSLSIRAACWRSPRKSGCSSTSWTTCLSTRTKSPRNTTVPAFTTPASHRPFQHLRHHRRCGTRLSGVGQGGPDVHGRRGCRRRAGIHPGLVRVSVHAGDGRFAEHRSRKPTEIWFEQSTT
jgi:hypothetical protein